MQGVLKKQHLYPLISVLEPLTKHLGKFFDILSGIQIIDDFDKAFYFRWCYVRLSGDSLTQRNRLI